MPGEVASPLGAALEVIAFLEASAIPYVVIGGLAVQHWGEPRSTRDVDITVLVAEDQEETFMKRATDRFSPRLEDAVGFARRSRVLLLKTDTGIPIDISLGIPGYEEEVMRRAVTVGWPGGRSVRIIGCEDLIIHKCVAGRPRDLEDVRTVLQRQGQTIDVEYIRKWLQAFADLLPERDVLGHFEEALRSVSNPTTNSG